MNDILARYAISSAKTPEQLFNREVGTKSSGDDFAGIDLMILAMSFDVTGWMVTNMLPVCDTSNAAGSQDEPASWAPMDFLIRSNLLMKNDEAARQNDLLSSAVRSGCRSSSCSSSLTAAQRRFASLTNSSIRLAK